MKYLAKLGVMFGLLVALLAPVMVPTTAHALVGGESKRAACEGVGLGGNACNTTSAGRINSLVRSGINVLSIIVGAVAVVMIIIGGLRYVTSAGDSAAVGTAKNTIVYALVGLVIAVLAQVLVKFVLLKTPS